MANLKVFVDKWTYGQTEERTDVRTDKQTGQKLYANDLSMRGHKNQPKRFLQELYNKAAY